MGREEGRRSCSSPLVFGFWLSLQKKNPKPNKPYSNYIIAIRRMKSNCSVTAFKSTIFVQSVAKPPPTNTAKTWPDYPETFCSNFWKVKWGASCVFWHWRHLKKQGSVVISAVLTHTGFTAARTTAGESKAPVNDGGLAWKNPPASRENIFLLCRGFCLELCCMLMSSCGQSSSLILPRRRAGSHLSQESFFESCDVTDANIA